jgi:hypothetical protein
MVWKTVVDANPAHTITLWRLDGVLFRNIDSA